MQTTNKKTSKLIFPVTVAPFSSQPKPTRHTWKGSPPQRSGRKGNPGNPPVALWGKKNTGKPFGNLFLAPQKKCHVDAIVSRFSLKKNKTYLFGLKSKNTSTNSVAGCVFLFGKSCLLQTHNITLRLQFGGFSETCTVADVMMIYG